MGGTGNSSPSPSNLELALLSTSLNSDTNVGQKPTDLEIVYAKYLACIRKLSCLELSCLQCNEHIDNYNLRKMLLIVK